MTGSGGDKIYLPKGRKEIAVWQDTWSFGLDLKLDHSSATFSNSVTTDAVVIPL